MFVRNESVPDERRARQILASVDDMLRKTGHRSVLFDTREMEAPTESVNAILRWWVDAGRLHDKVALIVKSDLKRIASNMRALSVGVKMRSFHELTEAEVWLRKPAPTVRAVLAPMPVAPASSPAPAASKPTNSRGRETVRDPAASRGKDSSGPRLDLGTDPNDPGPASRWRSSLLRGVVGSGDKS